MGLVVRDVLRPDGDVVRTSWPGVDDPAGGPLDGRVDELSLRGSRVVRRRRSALQNGPEDRDLLGVRSGVAGGLEDDRAVGRVGDLEE